ncbi:hypothetical protein LDENG_00187060, partial [Lucifuga dentata]
VCGWVGAGLQTTQLQPIKRNKLTHSDCSRERERERERESNNTEQLHLQHKFPSMLCLYVSMLLAVGGAGLAALQDPHADFGLKVFSQLAQHSVDTNLAFSPYGVSAVLGMVQLGAAGNTHSALSAAMGFSLQEPRMSREQRLLQRNLTAEKGVKMASGVMVERRMSLKKGFRHALAKAFQAHPNQVDFSKPDEAIRIINAWVSDHTAGEIPELFSPGSLNSYTRLVLLNALHFQALWKVPFDPKLTQQRMFHCANGSTVPVHMMRFTSPFKYGEFVTADGVDYDVVEMPYEGNSLSMFLISPFEHEMPLSVLSADMSSSTVKQWRAKMRRMRQELAMPRFTLSSTINLKSVLTQMGLADMFIGGTAGFTRITDDDQLFVSEILQKVQIEVNEQGTKGAAATAAAVNTRMAVVEITLDRPFLFLIQHQLTGAILFMGQFNHPEQQ